jgi:hypothetical protein
MATSFPAGAFSGNREEEPVLVLNHAAAILAHSVDETISLNDVKDQFVPVFAISTFFRRPDE